MYKIVYTKKALKDIEKIKQSSINSKAKSLIEVIRNNPYMTLWKVTGRIRTVYILEGWMSNID